jgi:hypothetical protein
MEISAEYLLEDDDVFLPDPKSSIKFNSLIKVIEFKRREKPSNTYSLTPKEQRAKDWVAELGNIAETLDAIDKKCDGGLKPSTNRYCRKIF